MRAVLQLALWTLAAAGAACSLPCSADQDCPSDLSCRSQRCVAVVGSSSSSSSDAASSSSGGGSSSSSSSSSGGSVDPQCPQPFLMALVRSSDGSNAQRGQVLRWSLGSGTPVACPVLSLRDTLDGWSTAVGWSGTHVIVGRQSHVTAVDPVLDSVAWDHAQSSQESGSPLDVFRARWNGHDVVGVSYDYLDGNIRALELFDRDDGTAYLRRFVTDGDPMNLHLTQSVAAHPTLEGHLLYGRGVTVEEMEIPTGDTATVQQVYTGNLTHPDSLRRVSSTVGPGGAGRVAYVQTAYLSMTHDDGTTRQLRGPFTCDLCNPMKALDAIPDPTDVDRLFAICEVNAVDHVVRIHRDGTCQRVLDGSTLIYQRWPARLAVAN